MGSNVSLSSPMVTPVDRLEEEQEESTLLSLDRKQNEENSGFLSKIAENIRGLVRGFTSLFSGGGIGGASGSGSTASISADSSALMRVFNDTWKEEMGGRGPGTIAAPLADGAGKNYGAVSLTQKWNLNSFVDWLKQKHPELGNKLVGTPASAEFDASWKKLGETDEKAFLDAQIEYTIESKVVPAINKIKEATGVDLNNGKYSEGVFSILMSMSNQRPAWVNEKWIPYLKAHPNATSEEIINGIGGDIANNYSGNYASSIRNRYKRQVANALKLTTPFSLNGATMSSGSSGSTSTASPSTSGSSSTINSSGTTVSFGGSGKFDSTYAITDTEKAQNQANEYWKQKLDSGDSLLSFKEGVSGPVKNVNKGNTSGWNSSYTNDMNTITNIEKHSYDSSKIPGGSSAWEQVNAGDAGTSGLIKPPSNTTITKPPITNNGGGSSSGSTITPPADLEEVKPPSTIIGGGGPTENPTTPVVPPNNDENNGSSLSPNNPTYIFDKEKFEKIMQELNLIEDYTSQIEETNNLLTKMKEKIKDNQSKFKTKVVNLKGNKNSLDGLFGGNSYNNDTMAIGF